MWVESEVSQGSRFFFTIASQLCPTSTETMVSRMLPFAKRTVLYVNTITNDTEVVNHIRELGLKPVTISDIRDVADKATCPHIDTVVIDSQTMVSLSHTFRCNLSDTVSCRPSNCESMSIYDTYLSYSYHL